MKRVAALFLAACLSLIPPSLALAQNSQVPASGGVAQQFKDGANGVGQGATQIGHGIKNGAILTWDAVKTGAQSFANTFSGNNNGASSSHP